ncbi:MAG: polysaccharide biosynthesis/export family protein [Opitutales bacterium]
MLAFAFAATSQAQNRQMTFPGTVREAPTSPDRRDEIVAPPPAAEATAQTTERRTTAAAQDSREDRLARAYQLRPQDQLNIEVFEEPEIGTTQRIDRDGRVRVMFLGTVSLSGMTARQAEQHLEQRFIEERYLRRPMVSVSIVEYAPRFVQISGAVPNPGNVFFDPEEERVELITAILRSGGFNDDANLRKIAITRTLDDGTEQIFIKDVNDKVKGRRGAADYKPFFLMPGDLVFVHDKVI